MPTEPEAPLVCPCPPVGLIDVVGKKWAVCVVVLLGTYGTVRFGPLQKSLSGVSPATLTATLRALERERLVGRPSVEGPRGPVRAYCLSETGQALYRTLRPLTQWLAQPSPVRRTRSFLRGSTSPPLRSPKPP